MSRDRRCFPGWYGLLALVLSFTASPIQAKYWGADPPVRCSGGSVRGLPSEFPGWTRRQMLLVRAVRHGYVCQPHRRQPERNLSRREPQEHERRASPAYVHVQQLQRRHLSRAHRHGAWQWLDAQLQRLPIQRARLHVPRGWRRPDCRYPLGAGGTFGADPGYFETLVRNPDGSFTLTQKDKTTYQFAAIPNTPFMPGTPVYQLTRITDRNNNTVTFTYAAGLLSKITDTYGRSLTFTYNANKRLSSVTDPLGRSTTFSYDGSGAQLVRITDPIGRSVQYRYNFLVQMTGKTDKDGRVFAYGYQSNEPVSVTDGANHGLFTMSNPTNWATNDTALAQNMVRQYVPSTTSKADGRGTSGATSTTPTAMWSRTSHPTVLRGPLLTTPPPSCRRPRPIPTAGPRATSTTVGAI